MFISKNSQVLGFTRGAVGLCLAVCLGACAAGQQQSQAPTATNPTRNRTSCMARIYHQAKNRVAKPGSAFDCQTR